VTRSPGSISTGAAEQGYGRAQHNLGLMYNHGRGVPRDDAAAVAWYLKAAGQGDTAAQVQLGILYGTGQGVSQDPAAAASWFRKAADQGEAAGQVAAKMTARADRRDA
jgi:uncharacterized protein